MIELKKALEAERKAFDWKPVAGAATSGKTFT